MVGMQTEGLRERKKRQTRAAIAQAAMRLFKARGFDAVTVAEVARAADVSEKTVFNYFPTKEDLVFGAATERLAAFVDAIRHRPAGTSLVAAFRAWTLELIHDVEHGSPEAIVAVPRLVMGSQALRDRLFLAWEQEAALLAPVLAEEAGDPADDIVPQVAARTLAWTRRMVFRTAFRRLLAGDDPVELAAELRVQANRAFDMLEQGFAGYGVQPEP